MPSLSESSTKHTSKEPTHILFFVPINDASVGLPPQFYAIPLDSQGVAYAAYPSDLSAEAPKTNLRNWFVKRSESAPFDFIKSKHKASILRAVFESNAGKPLTDFSPDESAYFGMGNMGVCIDKALIGTQKGNSESIVFSCL
jgi:hypothetical protein